MPPMPRCTYSVLCGRSLAVSFIVSESSHPRQLKETQYYVAPTDSSVWQTFFPLSTTQCKRLRFSKLAGIPASATGVVALRCAYYCAKAVKETRCLQLSSVPADTWQVTRVPDMTLGGSFRDILPRRLSNPLEDDRSGVHRSAGIPSQ